MSSDFFSPLDYNEFGFYHHMPDSVVEENSLGYYLKNNAIETYSYVSPKYEGRYRIGEFIDSSLMFFANGKEYFTLKLPQDENYLYNSKILKERGFLKSHLDISVMEWSEKSTEKLQPLTALSTKKITTKTVKLWVDVFFDAFSYPKNLRRYISSMVEQQIEVGIDFFVGFLNELDVSCFCSFDDNNYTGLYGVGTRKRFQRRGYAKVMLSNYMRQLQVEETKKDLKFCLQTYLGSGAERLYALLGFERVFVQKRFDWDPALSLENLPFSDF